LFIVPTDHRSDGLVCILDGRIPDAHNARTDQAGLRLVRCTDEKSVLEKVERDRKRVKANLGIPRGRQIGVAITDRGRDFRHFDDDSMSRQRRYLGIQRVHHRRELLTRDAVIEILVRPLHLARRKTQVFAPLLRRHEDERNL